MREANALVRLHACTGLLSSTGPYGKDLGLKHDVLQQQQNLWRRFGTSKMHLSPPLA